MKIGSRPKTYYFLFILTLRMILQEATKEFSLFFMLPFSRRLGFTVKKERMIGLLLFFLMQLYFYNKDHGIHKNRAQDARRTSKL